MDLTYESVSNQGERVLADDRPDLVRQHKERYEFASRYLDRAMRVLDCACGSGYGTEILARRAGEVVGMDISPVAVEYCRKHYPAKNLEFQVGSAEEIPLPSGSFDFFCSIETIEHIPHPEKLIREARRLLRPGGKFLVSTPNRVVSNLPSGEKPPYNPFHHFEWSFAEFDAHLRAEFPVIRYFGQRIRSRNKFQKNYVVSKLKRFAGRPDLVPLDGSPHALLRHESPASWQPENFLAVCSDGK